MQETRIIDEIKVVGRMAVEYPAAAVLPLFFVWVTPILRRNQGICGSVD